MIVVAGPTGSGKTELAAALARELGGEVVSADSRQVYRELDAATAKPSAALRAEIPHHLIDCADPAETYDAGRFLREARAAIAEIRARARAVVVCGGTGLYLRALTEGLAPLPPADPSLRARLNELARTRGREVLHEELARLDPAAAMSIPAGNIQRLVRALEVTRLTGRPISELWARGREGGMRPDAVLILTWPPAALAERLDARARAMWPALLDELEALVPARFRGDEPGLSSLGYPQALAVLRGELSSEDGLAEFQRATRAYAKRQRTWFRGQLKGAAIDACESPARTLALARAALAGAAGARA